MVCVYKEIYRRREKRGKYRERIVYKIVLTPIGLDDGNGASSFISSISTRKRKNDHSLSWSIQKWITLVPSFLAGFGVTVGRGSDKGWSTVINYKYVLMSLLCTFCCSRFWCNWRRNNNRYKVIYNNKQMKNVCIL